MNTTPNLEGYYGSSEDIKHIRSLSTKRTLGIPGYYVDGALSEQEEALLAPMNMLFSSIKSGDTVAGYLDRLIESNDPAIQKIFGQAGVSGFGINKPKN